jgi:hypothetical protein
LTDLFTHTLHCYKCLFIFIADYITLHKLLLAQFFIEKCNNSGVIMNFHLFFLSINNLSCSNIRGGTRTEFLLSLRFLLLLHNGAQIYSLLLGYRYLLNFMFLLLFLGFNFLSILLLLALFHKRLFGKRVVLPLNF